MEMNFGEIGFHSFLFLKVNYFVLILRFFAMSWSKLTSIQGLSNVTIKLQLFAPRKCSRTCSTVSVNCKIIITSIASVSGPVL